MPGRKKHKLGRVFLYLFAWLTSLFILYPYIVMFLGSLKDLQTMYRIPGTLLSRRSGTGKTT